MIVPAVRSPGGQLDGRAFGEDALDAADPPFAREAHAGLHEVGAIEREHHVALAAPLPQALLEEDVGSAGGGAVPDADVEAPEDFRDPPFHGLHGGLGEP